MAAAAAAEPSGACVRVCECAPASVSVCEPRARAGQRCDRGGSCGSRAAGSSLGRKRRRRQPGQGSGWDSCGRAGHGAGKPALRQDAPASSKRVALLIRRLGSPAGAAQTFLSLLPSAEVKFRMRTLRRGRDLGQQGGTPGCGRNGRGPCRVGGLRTLLRPRLGVLGGLAADGQTGAGMSLGRRGGGGGLEAERSPAAPACSSVGKKRGQCGFGGPRIRLPPGLWEAGQASSAGLVPRKPAVRPRSSSPLRRGVKGAGRAG